VLEKLAYDITVKSLEKCAAKWIRKWDAVRRAAGNPGLQTSEVNAMSKKLLEVDPKAYSWIHNRGPSIMTGTLFNRITQPDQQVSAANIRGLGKWWNSNASNLFRRRPGIFMDETARLTKQVREAKKELAPLIARAQNAIARGESRTVKLMQPFLEKESITGKELLSKLDPNTTHVYRAGSISPEQDSSGYGLFWSGLPQVAAGYTNKGGIYKRFNVAKLPDKATQEKLNIFPTPHFAESNPEVRRERLKKYIDTGDARTYGKNRDWSTDPNYEYVIPVPVNNMKVDSYFADTVPPNTGNLDPEFIMSNLQLKKLRQNISKNELDKLNRVSERVKDRTGSVIADSERKYMRAIKDRISEDMIYDGIRRRYKRDVFGSDPVSNSDIDALLDFIRESVPK